MNIALIYDRLTGGLPIATWTLARALAEERQRVLVLGPSAMHGHLAEDAVNAGVEFIPVTRRGLAGIPRSAKDRLVSFGADVLVSGHRGCDVYASRLAASLQTPHVCVLHGNPMSREDIQHPSIRFLGLRNWLWRRACARAAGVVCISKYVEEGGRSFGIQSEKMRVIHNAAPFKIREQDHNREMHAPLRLLAMGRLSAEKRPELFVEVLATLKQRGLSVQGRWLGTGPLLSALQEQAMRLGVSEMLELPGNTPYPLDEYDQADILLHFRLNEGFGLVLIEAQARGLPVVAFRAGAIPEVVEHERSGVLVEPEDIGAMADAVAFMAEQPAHYARLSEGALHAAAPFVDLSRLARDYLSLFNALL